MPGIDKFVQAIYQSGAGHLVIASGERVTLTTKEGARSVTSQPVASQQVLSLLKEILPAAHAPAVEAGRGCEFPYATSWGTANVKFIRSNGDMRLELAPAAPMQEAVAVAAQGPLDAVPGASPQPPRAHPRPADVPRPGTAAIDALFRKMVGENCSDLHLSTGHPALFRKDGEIVMMDQKKPLTADQTRDLMLPITPERNRAEFEERHDTDFSYEIPNLARFRCNLFMDRLGMGGVFRVIPSKIPSAKDLGLSKHIMEMCHLSKGLVVVTGPTGSGKSTTLAAMIDYINSTMSAHIITIEDPIEFVYPNGKCLINQREVGAHTGGFKSALRAALREDPDIVLVGEMRDLETVAIAIETAETGHLVFGTLHTNTAPSTVDRIIDQFPPDRQSQVRTMLSESLKGVIAQMLCKRMGGGRVVAHEVLIVTHAVSNLIREGKTFQIPSLMQAGRGVGMSCMNDALLALVKGKVIEPLEAYGKAVARAEMKSLLEREGFHLKLA